MSWVLCLRKVYEPFLKTLYCFVCYVILKMTGIQNCQILKEFRIKSRIVVVFVIVNIFWVSCPPDFLIKTKLTKTAEEGR